MKKNYLFLIALVFSASVYAQQITGLQVLEVLASDDFEDDAAWVNFDQKTGIDVKLNNALGGTQQYNWSNEWGGACVHGGKSAVSGNNCIQLHWGGTVRLQGFEINPDKVYQLEVMVHPLGGKSGEWNNWGAVHLFVFDQSNVWQTQGVRVRISNNGEGGSPALLALDVWEGEQGTERPVNLLQFSDKWTEYTIDDAKDATPGFWIPLKLVFRGEGSVAKPLIIDFYLKNKFVATQTFDNIYWLGDSMIGIQNGSDNSDVCRYDNIKLSVMSQGTGLKQTIAEEISVSQLKEGNLQIDSEINGENIGYTVYNISGIAVKKGNLSNRITLINSTDLTSGVYILQVKDHLTGNSKTVRTILK
ncbi:MAG: T9SS type A sorting domain-containing protein [Paludibacter sp.]|nr:T9SS type A sorting domain-containing protein [Paludibacter sp.]